MKAVVAMGSSKNYTDGSISGISGSLAGKNCTIKSITAVTGGQEVVFEWTADDGTVQTSSMVVKDGSKGAKGNQGKSVASVAFNANGKLVFTLDDGTELTPLDVPSTMVEVSKAAGNIIQQKADGMYAPATDLTNYVQKELGKGLSTNDYDATEKAEVAKIKNKVDKVTGKGLSTNDYDNTEKAEVAKVAGKVDKAQGVANKDKFLKVGADGNVTLGDVPSGTDIVTAWETTPVDTKVPSEKLVKDNLDTITQELAKKVAIAQGEANKGKALIVGNDGNVTCGTVATDNLTIVDKTQAQYDVLTDAEKNDATKLYNITDADDLDLTNYAKKSELDAISSVVTGMTKIKKIVTVMASSTTSQPVGSNEIVTLDLTSYGFTKVPKAFLVGTYVNTSMITYLTTTQMKVQLINVYSTARSDMKAQYHLIEFE